MIDFYLVILPALPVRCGVVSLLLRTACGANGDCYLRTATVQEHLLMRTATLASLAGLLLLSLQASAETLRLSEPVSSSETTETFGAALDETLPRFALSELVAGAREYADQTVLVETRVGKVCQKKGCFFVATEGDLALRVSFKDYGFFVPTDTSGKTVILAGRLVQQERSAKQAAHFNRDLKDGTEALAPGVVYEIVAEAVQIPRG